MTRSSLCRVSSRDLQAKENSENHSLMGLNQLDCGEAREESVAGEQREEVRTRSLQWQVTGAWQTKKSEAVRLWICFESRADRAYRCTVM